MNTKALNSLAGVICRAQEQDRTPMGIAFAVDSAGMHMSPEVAAKVDQLRARVAELEAARDALAVRLQSGQRWQRGRTPALVSQDYVSQDELRAIFGIPLAAPWGDASAPADRLTALLAPTQALREDGAS